MRRGVTAFRPPPFSHADLDTRQRNLTDGDFYVAAGNPQGLHLSAAGAMLAGQPVPVEVWVGGDRVGEAPATAAAGADRALSTVPELSRPATSAEIARGEVAEAATQGAHACLLRACRAAEGLAAWASAGAT